MGVLRVVQSADRSVSLTIQERAGRSEDDKQRETAERLPPAPEPGEDVGLKTGISREVGLEMSSDHPLTLGTITRSSPCAACSATCDLGSTGGSMLRRNEVENGFEGVWRGEARARPRVRETVVGRTRGVRVAYKGARATRRRR